MAATKAKTYVVEHLDPELGDWSALEYKAIAKESTAAGSQFVLSSVPISLVLPADFADVPGFRVENESVEEAFKEERDRICLLDPAAEKELSPEDADLFDLFLFGGILGDDPPRDRTKELRQKGFQNRRLGPVQMTTDTAVRATRMVIQDQMSLERIPYVDHPEFKVDEHESTQMPFRYIVGEDGNPIMPDGMLNLIKKDSERGFGDVL